MTDFGERLRKERESRGVSLREMAEATKIGKRYLEALERNDFDALPGTVFAKGYIRTYAEQLGLDPEPLLADYQRERLSRGGDEEEEEQAAQDAAQAVLSHLAASRGVTPPSARRTGWIVGISVLAVALVAVPAWFLFGPSGPERADVAEAAPSPQTEAAPATAPSVSPETAQAPTEEDVTAGSFPARSEPAPAAQPPPDSVTLEPEPVAPAPVPRQEAEETSDRVARLEPVETDAVVEEPGPEPAAESSVATRPAASQLSVPDYGVGTGVEDRQLVGRDSSFPEGAAVWFWTRVLGGRPGDTIRHVWIREGRTQGAVELSVSGSHWRTQSRWSMRPGSAGAWAVEARDAGGRLLARAEFVCVPAD